MIILVRGFFSLVLDGIYPSRCELCDSSLEGNGSLCSDCTSGLPRIHPPFCKRCGECHDGRIDSVYECGNCAGIRFAFEFCKPVLRRDPAALDLVHRFKYLKKIHLCHSLGSLLAESFDDPRFQPALEGKWPLVPVPLHRRRLRHRHFNQSEELARVVSHHTSLPVAPVLRRVRDTGTQTALGRKARQSNLKQAFSLRHSSSAPVAGAILVDDVFTTGSTLHECAATLRRGGCQSVFAITLLRG